MLWSGLLLCLSVLLLEHQGWISACLTHYPILLDKLAGRCTCGCLSLSNPAAKSEPLRRPQKTGGFLWNPSPSSVLPKTPAGLVSSSRGHNTLAQVGLGLVLGADICVVFLSQFSPSLNPLSGCHLPRLEKMTAPQDRNVIHPVGGFFLMLLTSGQIVVDYSLAPSDERLCQQPWWCVMQAFYEFLPRFANAILASFTLRQYSTNRTYFAPYF